MEELSEVAYKVKRSKIGEFKIELDWDFGKKIAQDQIKNKDNSSLSLSKVTGDIILDAAKQVVPVEISCPPILEDQIPLVEKLVKRLRKAGAKGTHTSPVYAFGLHINPELEENSSEYIIKIIKSFIVSQKWLIKKHNVDLTRRISSYIELYPRPYSQLVLNYSGKEDIKKVASDYLRYNQSRNRALDLFPLFENLIPGFVKKNSQTKKLIQGQLFTIGFLTVT